jgi:hypothetical protein
LASRRDAERGRKGTANVFLFTQSLIGGLRDVFAVSVEEVLQLCTKAVAVNLRFIRRNSIRVKSRQWKQVIKSRHNQQTLQMWIKSC